MRYSWNRRFDWKCENSAVCLMPKSEGAMVFSWQRSYKEYSISSRTSWSQIRKPRLPHVKSHYKIWIRPPRFLAISVFQFVRTFCELNLDLKARNSIRESAIWSDTASFGGEAVIPRSKIEARVRCKGHGVLRHCWDGIGRGVIFGSGCGSFMLRCRIRKTVGSTPKLGARVRTEEGWYPQGFSGCRSRRNASWLVGSKLNCSIWNHVTRLGRGSKYSRNLKKNIARTSSRSLWLWTPEIRLKDRPFITGMITGMIPGPASTVWGVCNAMYANFRREKE